MAGTTPVELALPLIGWRGIYSDLGWCAGRLCCACADSAQATRRDIECLPHPVVDARRVPDPEHYGMVLDRFPETDIS
jgi:hypothetical protein